MLFFIFTFFLKCFSMDKIDFTFQSDCLQRKKLLLFRGYHSEMVEEVSFEEEKINKLIIKLLIEYRLGSLYDFEKHTELFALYKAFLKNLTKENFLTITSCLEEIKNNEITSEECKFYTLIDNLFSSDIFNSGEAFNSFFPHGFDYTRNKKNASWFSQASSNEIKNRMGALKLIEEAFDCFLKIRDEEKIDKQFSYFLAFEELKGESIHLFKKLLLEERDVVLLKEIACKIKSELLERVYLKEDLMKFFIAERIMDSDIQGCFFQNNDMKILKEINDSELNKDFLINYDFKKILWKFSGEEIYRYITQSDDFQLEGDEEENKKLLRLF